VANGRAWATVSLSGNMVILLHCVNVYFVHRTTNLFGSDIDAGSTLQKN
jgi:hypothetical protein